MDIEEEAQRRKQLLIEALLADIKTERRLGHLEYGTSMILLSLAILASVFAGFGGLLGFLGAQATGAIVLASNLPLIFAKAFKLEERAGWHYRKRNRLDDLKDQLIFQQPAIPTLEQIAQINKKKHGLNKVMQDEWDEKLVSNWESIDQRPKGIRHANDQTKHLQE